ncbi:MAG: ABC transporter ATP-binding protein [Polyangiaceae bacterium]|nr:ABC transporter ATP-binding protein [Polyangiaceae bacterium]
MSLVALEVTVALRGRPVLERVSLSLEPGSIDALVGPNGAGKSTLIAALAGTVAPSRGAVELDGQVLATLSRQAIARRVAVVTQDAPAPPGYTARQIVALGRAPHQGALMLASRADEAAVDEAMERAGVRALASRAVDELSGGERRRVALARSLAQAADYLLMDEPAANLDLDGEARLFELARDEAARGRGVLVVLHDLEAAARLADRVTLLASGRVVGAGAPEETLTAAALSRAFGVAVDVAASPLDGGLHVLPASHRRHARR